MLWTFVSLKTLPDGTYPGILRKLMTIGFTVVIPTQVTIPDQLQKAQQPKQGASPVVALDFLERDHFDSNHDCAGSLWYSQAAASKTAAEVSHSELEGLPICEPRG
jgi:hypothetical protein